jgi:hypothetical protein
MNIPKSLHDALVLLNVWSSFVRLTAMPSFEAAEKGLEELKAEAARNWKQLAFDAHPDRGGDLERMTALNVARDEVVKLVIGPPPQQMVVIRVVYGGGFGGVTSASTTGW